MKLIGDGGHAKVVRTLRGSLGTIVAIGNNRDRKRVSDEHPKEKFGVAIHNSVFLWKDAEIGDGTVIMAGAIVQPGCKIGKHVILNTGCSVDHDCVLEDYVHIAPGAHLCGNVTVGEGTLVGTGVCIAPNTVIPPWSLVKARRLEIVPL